MEVMHSLRYTVNYLQTIYSTQHNANTAYIVVLFRDDDSGSGQKQLFHLGM
jgi:hypothetical protein